MAAVVAGDHDGVLGPEHGVRLVLAGLHDGDAGLHRSLHHRLLRLLGLLGLSHHWLLLHGLLLLHYGLCAHWLLHGDAHNTCIR